MTSKEIQTIATYSQPSISPASSSQSEGYFSSFWGKAKNLFNQVVHGNVAEIMDRDELLRYFNDREFRVCMKHEHQRFLDIYHRLASIPKGSGTWADGIDLELLDDDVPDQEAECEEFEDVDFDINELFLSLPERVCDQTIEPSCLSGTSGSTTNDPYQFQPLSGLTPPEDRLLLLIHGDEFGKGSELEGGDLEKTTKYLHDYTRKKGNYSPALVNQLGNAVSVKMNKDHDLFGDEAIKTARNKIQEAFTSKTPLLINGGWTGTPAGHAICYEIIPDEYNSECATFRLYNTGAGVDQHDQVRDGIKVKYKAYSEWKGISCEKLTSEHFLLALYELNRYATLPYSSTKTDYHENDIYQALKAILEPRQDLIDESDAFDRNLMMSTQRSGVCAWRSLMAFMRSKMELREYKQFKCDIKLQSLSDYVNNSVKPVTHINWRLVRKCHQNLCRNLVDLYRKGMIGQDYIRSAQHILRPIAEWLRQNSGCRYEKNIENIRFNYEQCSSQQAYSNKHTIDLPLHQMIGMQQSGVINNQTKRDSFQEFQQIDSTNPATILGNLMQVNGLSHRAWIDRDDLALHTGLVHFVKEMDIDESFWRAAIASKKENTEALIVQLGELAKFFFKSCYTVPNADILFVEKVCIMCKLLHIQKTICDLGMKDPIWNGMVVDMSGIDQRFAFTRISDAKMNREIHAIKTKTGDVKYILCKSVKVTDERTGIKFEFKKPNDTRNRSLQLEDIIRKQYPEEISRIERQDPAFMGLPKTQQDARIFSSTCLPDWIKALRDTQISLHNLLNVPVQNLASLDRDSDLECEFEVQDKDEDCKVCVNLKGINPSTVNKVLIPYFAQAKQYPNDGIELPTSVFSGLNKPNLFGVLYEKIIPQISKLSLEESRELVRLFTKSELKLVETLEYFTKYPEKLKEPGHQVLLQILFFELGLLDKSLKVEGFIDHLTSFLERNYQEYREKNEIRTAVYLLKLTSQISSFCPPREFFHATTRELQNILNQEGIEIHEKCMVYSELVAQLRRKDTLTEDEVVLLLQGAIYLQENKSNERFVEDPVTAKEAREALLVHGPRVVSTLMDGNPNQQLLNRLLIELRGASVGEKQWVIEQNSEGTPAFATIDGNYIVHPLLARMISPEIKIALPLNILQNPLFKQLFPTIKEAVYYTGEVFAFRDQRGVETLVHLNGDHIIIDQKLDPKSEGWYRFIPSNSFIDAKDKAEIKSLVGSRYLVEQYPFWQSLESKDIFAIDPKTGKREYLIIAQPASSNFASSSNSVAPELNAIREVISLNNRDKLGKPSNLFTEFEDPSYIHEWYDEEGNLSKLELPRFNLSFKPVKDKFICEQFPGYFLNRHDPVPELGIHHHSILIESADGKKKAIIPQQQFQSPEKKEVLIPRYHMDRKLDLGDHVEQQKYVVFDVLPSGRLFSKSRPANLYLAQVLCVAQEYKKAARYIKKSGEKLSPYTNSEVEILRKMSTTKDLTGDQSGNGIALQLYANYLLIKNALANNLDLTSFNQDFKNLKAVYDLYLLHYKHVTVIKMTLEEEVFILKGLLHDAFDPGFFLRLKELDPEAASHVRIQMTHEDKSIATREVKIPMMIRDHYHKRSELLTRINIEDYSKHFYDVARVGSEEDRAYLRQALHFLRNSGSNKNVEYANFYQLVLDNPTLFPAAPKTSSYYNDKIMEAWDDQVETIVNELLANQPQPNINPEPKNFGNVTPDHFHLDAKKIWIPEMTLGYALKELPGFAETCLGLSAGLVQRPGTGLEDFLQQCKLSTSSGASTSTATSTQGADPLNREFDRLLDDVAEYQNQMHTPVYTMDENELDHVRKILSKDKDGAMAQLKDLELGMIALANKDSDSEIDQVENQLQKWGGLRKVITVEEMMIAFARKNPRSMQERNPGLTEADVNALFEMVGMYLLHATREQQRTRAEGILNKIQDLNTQEGRDHINALAQEMLAVRHYDPDKYPAYLVFEYFDNISMRPAQVAKLEKFLVEKDFNIIMEMIMGSGKSKVLLPLLGLMLADGDALSMLIVPQALYESVSQDTQTKLHEFSQSLRSLHFDRKTKVTKDFLQTILDDLIAIRTNKECLIMTNKSVQCLILKFIQMCSDHFTGPDKGNEFPEELKIMQQIINTIRQNGHPILDEADTILNLLHQVCFSVGKKLAPESYEIDLISEIYSLLYEEEAFKNRVHLESDPTANPGTPALTESLYEEKIKEPLARALMNRLGTMHFNSQTLTNKMHQFISGLDGPKRELLIHYICRNEGNLAFAQRFYDSLDEEIKNVISLAGEEISHLMPFTLTRICDEKYGLGTKSSEPYAIPFSAALTPNEDSQFSNRHITMNYTFQAYMKKGVTPEIIESQIKRLQESAIKEMAASNGRIDLKNTIAGKAFQKLKDEIAMPLFNYQPSHIQKIVERVNQTPALKREFVTTIILPQLEYYEKKITCNPINLVSFFNKRVVGFTGTLWNGMSMHRKMDLNPEKGTDAKTLSILWKHSQSNAIEFKEGTTDEMLQQLQDGGVDFDMISDAGGYFKDGTNAEIAHKIGSIKGKETVYYNNEGEQTITDGSKELSLIQSVKQPEERITFLDQAHTTGSDVPQKRDAVSLVTIGRNMTLRDLLQSVWRLRGLDKSQRVRFLISNEVAGIIRQTLRLPENHPIQLDVILKFVIANQAAQQGRDNYKALKQSTSDVEQQILFDVLTNERLVPKARQQAFNHLHKSWIKPAFFSSKDMYGHLSTQERKDLVLEVEKQQSTQKMIEIFAKMPWLEKIDISQQKCIQEVEAIIEGLKSFLHERIESPVKENEDDQTVEVERENENETETETETELEVQQSNEVGDTQFVKCELSSGNAKEKINLCRSLSDAIKIVRDCLSRCTVQHNDIVIAYLNQIPAFPLKSYFEINEELNVFTTAFEGIYVTMNVLEFDRSLTLFQLLGANRLGFHHVLIKENKVVLLSQEEASAVRESPDYYNLTLGHNDKNKVLSKDLLLKIVKLKFLNGDAHYSEEELVLLKRWIKSQGNEKMQNFYLSNILRGYPKKTARYQNSPLQRLFNSI